jgi:tRNA-splicing ligase RtcB
MARGEAKRSITLEMHREATKGVFCKKDKSVIDESPHAYKDIDKVMDAQIDLVDIIHTLTPIVNIKG